MENYKLKYAEKCMENIELNLALKTAVKLLNNPQIDENYLINNSKKIVSNILKEINNDTIKSKF